MIFNNNKYTHYYDSIISRAKSRTSCNGYVENHHIIPKCLGGKNEISNLVSLTAREHFICHWLLTKMVSGTSKFKMIYALNGMKRIGKKQDRYVTKITSRTYASIKLKIIEQISNDARGKAPAIDSITRQSLGKILITDSRWKTGEIVGHTSGYPGTMIGKHAAKLTNSGTHVGAILLSDPRWKTGEIISAGKGNKFTEIHKQNIKLSRKEGLANGTIVPWNKGIKTGKNTLGKTASAKDSKTGKMIGRISTDDIRWKTGEIVGPRKII